jgi:two-component system response regulator MprA
VHILIADTEPTVDEAIGRAISFDVGARRSALTELRCGDLVLDLTRRELRRGAYRAPLTQAEARLLELLMRNDGDALSRAEIIEGVWGRDFGDRPDAVDVYVAYLRLKTETGGATRVIQTVRGVGYALREL